MNEERIQVHYLFIVSEIMTQYPSQVDRDQALKEDLIYCLINGCTVYCCSFCTDALKCNKKCQRVYWTVCTFRAKWNEVTWIRIFGEPNWDCFYPSQEK